MRPLPYWVDVQVDLSLCSSDRSYCRFSSVLAQFKKNNKKKTNYAIMILQLPKWVVGWSQVRDCDTCRRGTC